MIERRPRSASATEKNPMTPLVLLMLVALPLPLGAVVTAAAAASGDQGELTDDTNSTSAPFYWWSGWHAPALLAIVALTFFLARNRPRTREVESLLLGITLVAGAALPFVMLADGIQLGVGVWVFLVGLVALFWHELDLLSGREGFARHLLVPGLFGIGIVYLWQVVVQGLDVPEVLLPPPSGIVTAFAHEFGEMWDDFAQTVLKSVIRGYVLGCAAGFAVAIIADRIPFLARGLLPFGNLVSALPIVGVAPIMVMWFGFDWQSKAAVVVVMTFFPMLINTLAGLAASERIQLDLMRSYGAGYWRTLAMLRLPNALPFIFNALKINSTLSLIGAIVAEFFGTPIVGMGFRISTEVARMDLGVVWATIVVAALTGSLAYGGLALIERSVTAWHPSYRRP